MPHSPLVQATSSDVIAIWYYNMGWLMLYVTMMWNCYMQGFWFLLIDGDEGAYFFRCYNSFASGIEFWSTE